MAKKKTKSKPAVVPMTFNSAVTPIGVDASWTGLAVTALEAERGFEYIVDGQGGGVAKKLWTVRMSEVLSTKPGDFPSQSARLERLGGDFLRTVNRGRGLEPLMSVGVVSDRGRAIRRSPMTQALVAIEGYAMGSKTRPQMAGELGGHLRLLLWQAGIPYIIVPPRSLKSYVTGSGNSPKEVMMMTTYKRWGYESENNDQCDAYCLARLAAEFAAGSWTKKFTALAQGFDIVPVKGAK